MRRQLALALIGASLLLGAGCTATNTTEPSSEKTTVVYDSVYPYYSTVEQLVQTADLVIRATTISSEVRELNSAIKPTTDDPVLNPGGEYQPSFDVYTVYSFEVAECYKGCSTPGGIVEVKVPGGELDGIDYLASGEPTFKANKKYILFLTTFTDSPAVLLNADQSAYSDSTDKDGNYVSVGQNNQLKLPPGQIKKLFSK